MDVLVVPRVAFKTGVEVASEHDAYLNVAKGLADACEFHLESPKERSLGCLRIESGENVIQQVDHDQRDAAADSRAQQSTCLLGVASERVEEARWRTPAR
jgi:hypothetical protein